MLKYLKLWLKLSSFSFQTFFVSRFGALLFLCGKVLRFIFFLVFLIVLLSKTKVLAGYDIWQVLLFYLTFNLIDSTTQMLFREVYRFRTQIVTGSFDLILVKPVNVLFRSLFGWTDILDLITILPLVVFIIYIANYLHSLTLMNVILYIFLVLNSLLLAMSFHIMVLSLAILTTEIDHAIMIYRDFTSMGRFPIDIYKEPLRSLVTFAVPVGLMMSFPVQALLGQLKITLLVISISFGIVVWILSLKLWHYSLKKYTSASS